MQKPNFNRNNEIIGSCQGSLVLIKGTVYLNIGILLKKYLFSSIECVGISGKGKSKKNLQSYKRLNDIRIFLHFLIQKSWIINRLDTCRYFGF